MKAATDPNMDHPANLAALNVLMATYSYGAGEGDKASIEKAKNSFYEVTGGQQFPQTGGGFNEGQTATNPSTGDKIVYKNGQWVPAR